MPVMRPSAKVGVRENFMNGARRTFKELRQAILIGLLPGQQTTNGISVNTGINWRTAEAHLKFLVDKGFVSEVLKLAYVRIFKLTPIGEEHARFLLQANGNASFLQLPQHDPFAKRFNPKTQLLQQQRKERGEKARQEGVMQP